MIALSLWVYGICDRGRNGDLARRMLLPSIYALDADGLLAQDTRITAVARQKIDRDLFVDMARTAVADRTEGPVDAAVWTRFAERLDYFCGESGDDRGARALEARIGAREAIFYLAISPDLYERVCDALTSVGLNASPSRVVLEKPIGRDAASSEARTLPSPGLRKIELTGSTTTSEKRQSRTCSRSASPTPCSNRCGTISQSTMYRLRWPKPGAWVIAGPTMTTMAPHATCCRTIFSNCCASWRWSCPPASNQIWCATKRLR